MDKGLEAALRRFPLRHEELRRLAQDNETFRGMCEDLADAEAAFARWSGRPAKVLNESRASEYGKLVSELVLEIEQMLDRTGSNS
ncbi:hypothetical protein ACSSV1_005251 [Labrenzia sp. MBR-25]|jgi:hypothetical protein